MSRGTIPCFVNGCLNRAGNKEDPKSFFRFPKVLIHQSEDVHELSAIRRSAWIKAVGRKREPSKYSRICEDHFIGKKPAKLQDMEHPDWVPTLLLMSDDHYITKGKKSANKT